MKIYNHAYTISFTLETALQGDKVGGQALRTALSRRIMSLSDEDLLEATELYDTYELQEADKS